VTFGPNQYELNLAQTLGYDAYLDYHINYDQIDDSAIAPRIAPLTTLNRIYADIYTLSGTQVINELIEATLIRATYSKRQLFERMMEFWSDHFNIYVEKENCAWLKIADDRDALRPNAMGFFSDLLASSATSPAMLVYLDNHTSYAGNPNENYARELMELHTMGTDGGYTQTDVQEVARCFTGWTFHGNSAGYPLAGVFRFNGSQHDNGEKRVFGQFIAAGGGLQDGLTVLQILTDHPSTAKFICTKLCKRFLSYDPPRSVINAAVAKFTSTGGNIAQTMRTILAAPHVSDAPVKFKRPFHAFVSAMRSVDAEMIASGSVRNQLKNAGHLVFYWFSPDGFPDKLDFWSGLLLPRWNFGANLMLGALTGVSANTAAFFAGLTTANQINTAIFGGEMTTADRNRIRDYLLPDAPTPARQQEALGLAIGSPGFQWY